MDFEFDSRKCEANKRNHGIDFFQVEALWEDPELLEVPARTEDEARYLVIGMIDAKHWSCVITYRDERVRIISARRSRKGEVSLYES